MEYGFCADCGHAASEHSLGGWTGKRCLAYPGKCDCIAYAAESDGFDLADMRADAWACLTTARDGAQAS